MNESNYLKAISKIFHAITLWFIQHKRDLPWRKVNDPYLVWISEIMLQQTQVDVVIPYFLRWKEKFPNLAVLARADLDEVLSLFAGLGYYTRPKNIHLAAKKCLEIHEGKFPTDKNSILELPGIGSYTAGAILSFAFKQKAAAVDGNVLRLVSRFLGSEDPIDSLKTKRNIEELIESHLPNEKPYETMEALIELGALVCSKKPKCHVCPIQNLCCAFRQKKTQLLPLKSKNNKTIKITKDIYIYLYENMVYVEKKQKGEWNQGLYEFPSDPLKSYENVKMVKTLKEFKGYITKYEIRFIPKIYKLNINPQQVEFVELTQLENLAFSSNHKKNSERIKKRTGSSISTPVLTKD